YIYQALWLAGHGYIMVSKSGQALDRSLVDASVWQPERLDFAAQPVLGEGLSRVVPAEAEAILPGVPMLATAALQPKWTMAEWRKKSRKLQNARKALSGKIAQARNAYVAERIADLKALGRPAADIKRMAAAFRRAVEHRCLSGEISLLRPDGTTVTV